MGRRICVAWAVLLLFLLVCSAEVAPPNFWASTVNEKHIGEGVRKSVTKGNNEGPVLPLSDKQKKKEKGDQPRMAQFVEAVPEILEFHERPICTAAVLRLNLTNLSPPLHDGGTELQLYSIATDSIHFHITFFKEHHVAPNNRSSVSVVFLPRCLGPVEASLVVESNFGRFIYRARGHGIPNPYKLRSIVGTKVPYGVPHSPSIQLYNPRSHSIQVTEVFTSGGFLHLLLPSNKSQQVPAASSNSSPTQALWEVEPHSSKTVIYLNFELTSIGKYQGFVNIKVDDTDLPGGSEAMILHVEVTVVQNEVHVQCDEIEFGVLNSLTSISHVPLVILNAGVTPVLVTDIAPLLPNDMLKVYLTNPIIPPGLSVTVATLEYYGMNGTSVNGKIIVHTNDSNTHNSRLEVPYSASVVIGHLSYDVHSTLFALEEASSSLSSPSPPPPFEGGGIIVERTLTVKNQFPIPIALYSIEIEDSRFTANFLAQFDAGIVASPGGDWPQIDISFQANQSEMVYSRLHLITNLTSLYIPFQAYTGRLSCTLPGYGNCSCPGWANGTIHNEQQQHQVEECPFAQLDFGACSVGSTHTITLNLANPNPVEVTIYHIMSNISAVTIHLDVLLDSNGNRLPVYPSTTTTTTPMTTTRVNDDDQDHTDVLPPLPLLRLGPGHVAVFIVALRSLREEQAQGAVTIRAHPTTDIHIPILFRSVEGSISFSPAEIHFDFPANMTDSSLHRIRILASSSCRKPAQIISITTTSPLFVASLLSNTIHESTDDQEVITLSLDPTAIPNAIEKRTAPNRFDNEPSLGYSTTAEYTGVLEIHTDLFGVYRVQLRGTVSLLPRLVDFGVVMTGTTASKTIPFHNPSSKDMWVTLSLKESVQSTNVEWESDEYEWDTADFAIHSISSVEHIHVPPRTTVQIGPILFSPQLQHQQQQRQRQAATVGGGRGGTSFVSKSVATLLVLDNSFDVVAQTELRGEGGAGKLLFLRGEEVQSQLVFELGVNSCRPPSPPAASSTPSPSSSPSPLPLPQTHFHSTHIPSLPTSARPSHPSLEIFQSLEIVNIGNMRVGVDRVGLNGKACNAHGFFVHNCTEHFDIEIGQRKTLFVSHLPDFTSSLVQRELFLYTSQGLVVLPVIAKFGNDQLTLCNEYQSTENNQLLRLFTLTVLGIIFLFLSVLVVREYCTPSSLSSAESKIPDAHAADKKNSCINLPLPDLPNLDPTPSVVAVEKLDKLTYDGYRVNKKGQSMLSKSGNGGGVGSGVETSGSGNGSARTSPTATDSMNPPFPPSYTVQPFIPFSPYASPYPPYLLDPSQQMQFQAFNAPFTSISSLPYSLQPPFHSVPPHPAHYINKPGARSTMSETEANSNSNGDVTPISRHSSPSPPPVSPPIPSFIAKAVKSNVDRKRKGSDKIPRSTEVAYPPDPHSVNLSPPLYSVPYSLPFAPTPPPLPTGSLSRSAQGMEFIRKKNWSTRSQSDSALLPTSEGNIVTGPSKQQSSVPIHFVQSKSPPLLHQQTQPQLQPQQLQRQRHQQRQQQFPLQPTAGPLQPKISSSPPLDLRPQTYPQPDQSSQALPQPAQTQPTQSQLAQPQPAKPQAAQNQTAQLHHTQVGSEQSSTQQPPIQHPRTQPNRAQPQRAQSLRQQKTQPQQAQPQQAQPQQAQTQQTQTQQAQTQQAQTQQAQPQQAQPQQAQPQQAQPQQAQPQQAQPQQAQPQQAQPHQTQPHQTQPQQTQPQQPQSQSPLQEPQAQQIYAYLAVSQSTQPSQSQTPQLQSPQHTSTTPKSLPTNLSTSLHGGTNNVNGNGGGNINVNSNVTGNVTGNNSATSFAYNIAELKKRGIHRRDLVKGSTALPPNMAFVPKKRPVPSSPPTSSTSSLPASPEAAPLALPMSPAESPLSPVPRRHSSAPTPTFRVLMRGERLGDEMEGPLDSTVPNTQASTRVGTGVGSLGGISLRGVSTQRKDAIGVIGSGKAIHASPPAPTPSHLPSFSPGMFSFLTPCSSPSPSPSPAPSPNPNPIPSPSSLFSLSPRSPLHFSSPLPANPSPFNSLRSSSPLPSTYDLFAPTTNPLFTPSIFDSSLIPPPSDDKQITPTRAHTSSV